MNGMRDDAPLAPDAAVAAAEGPDGERARGAGTAAGLGVLLAFTATTFLSAVLLFSMQPMFAKMVLPLLGGAPSVWAVALLFFQGALLVGYGYAHLLVRKVPPRAHRPRASCARGARRFSCCRSAFPRAGPSRRPGMPISGSSGCSRSRSGCRSSRLRPTRRCLQAWFARTGHPHARPIPTFSMPPRTSAACSRCSAIRSCSSRCSGSGRWPRSGR